MVECHLAKVDVEGSNPFSRSRKTASFYGSTHSIVGAAEKRFRRTHLESESVAF